MRNLVILRPEPGASATAAAARAMGLNPIVVPLFQVRPVSWILPDCEEFDGLLITSANALRHGGPQLERLRHLPVHAVGEATAAAARESGFKVRSVGNSGVTQLLGSLPSDLRLLHLSGVDRTPTREVAQAIAILPVYESRECAPPEEFTSLIEGKVTMIHSPRAAQRFAALVDEGAVPRATITLAAISERAAIAAGYGWGGVHHSSAPDDEALLALAASLCNSGIENR